MDEIEKFITILNPFCKDRKFPYQLDEHLRDWIILPMIRLILQNQNAVINLKTEIQNLKSEIDEMRKNSKEENINSIIKPNEFSMHWILFACSVLDKDDDYNYDCVDVFKVDNFPLIYVKLFFFNDPEEMNASILTFNNKILVLLKNGKIKLLHSQRITNVNDKTFAHKINQAVDHNIRRYDRCILPLELNLTYSIRSFVDYKYPSSDGQHSLDFLTNLFEQLSDK